MILREGVVSAQCFLVLLASSSGARQSTLASDQNRVCGRKVPSPRYSCEDPLVREGEAVQEVGEQVSGQSPRPDVL